MDLPGRAGLADVEEAEAVLDALHIVTAGDSGGAGDGEPAVFPLGYNLLEGLADPTGRVIGPPGFIEAHADIEGAEVKRAGDLLVVAPPLGHGLDAASAGELGGEAVVLTEIAAAPEGTVAVDRFPGQGFVIHHRGGVLIRPWSGERKHSDKSRGRIVAEHGDSARQLGRANIGENTLLREGVHDEISAFLGAEKELQGSAARGGDESLQVRVPGGDRLLHPLCNESVSLKAVLRRAGRILEGLQADEGDGIIVVVQMLLARATAPDPAVDQPLVDAMAAVCNRLIDAEFIAEHKGSARGGRVEILSRLVVAKAGAEEALVTPPVSSRKPVAVGNQVSCPFAIGELIRHGMHERAIDVFVIAEGALGGFLVGPQPVDPVTAESIFGRFRQDLTHDAPLRILLGQFKTRPTACRAADDTIHPDGIGVSIARFLDDDRLAILIAGLGIVAEQMLHEEHAPERQLLVVSQGKEFLDTLPLGLIGPGGLLGIRKRPLLDLLLRWHHRRGSAPLDGAPHLGRQCFDIHRRRKFIDFFLSAIRVGHHQLRSLGQDGPTAGRRGSFIDACEIAMVVCLPLANQKAVVGKIPQPRRQIFAESRVCERCGDIETAIRILVGDLRRAEGLVHTVLVRILCPVFFPVEGAIDRCIEGRPDLPVRRPRFAQRVGDGMPSWARCGPSLIGVESGFRIIRVRSRLVTTRSHREELLVQKRKHDFHLLDLLACVDERRDFLSSLGEADHGAAVESVEGQGTRLTLPLLFAPDRMVAAPFLGEELLVVPGASRPALGQGDRLIPVPPEHAHTHSLRGIDR